jgi:hypothetical protein
MKGVEAIMAVFENAYDDFLKSKSRLVEIYAPRSRWLYHVSVAVRDLKKTGFN